MGNLPKNYLSYNQIRIYQTCPLKYYFHYIEGIGVPSNDRIILGSAFHETVEKYFNKKIDGVTISEKEIITIFKTVFNDIVNKNEINWIETKASTLKKGVSFVKFFFKDIAKTLNPVMVEKNLSFVIPELDIEIKGIIDIIEKDFSISDFKTSTAKWSKSRIQHSKLQIIIYKYLFEQNFETSASSLYFKVFHSKNDKNIKYQNLKVISEEDDIEKMIKIIALISENIKKGSFYKNESYACSFCDYKSICKNYSSTGNKI